MFWIVPLKERDHQAKTLEAIKRAAPHLSVGAREKSADVTIVVRLGAAGTREIADLAKELRSLGKPGVAAAVERGRYLSTRNTFED